MTAVPRSILRDLDRLRPQTVPQLARARLVSREDIQPIVNALACEGLVEFVANPAHRRSPLVQLTPQGKALLEEIRCHEREVAAQLELPISAQEIASATAVLRAARKALEGLWPRKRSEVTKRVQTDACARSRSGDSAAQLARAVRLAEAACVESVTRVPFAHRTK